MAIIQSSRVAHSVKVGSFMLHFGASSFHIATLSNLGFLSEGVGVPVKQYKSLSVLVALRGGSLKITNNQHLARSAPFSQIHSQIRSCDDEYNNFDSKMGSCDEFSLNSCIEDIQSSQLGTLSLDACTLVYSLWFRSKALDGYSCCGLMMWLMMWLSS